MEIAKGQVAISQWDWVHNRGTFRVYSTPLPVHNNNTTFYIYQYQASTSYVTACLHCVVYNSVKELNKIAIPYLYCIYQCL